MQNSKLKTRFPTRVTKGQHSKLNTQQSKLFQRPGFRLLLIWVIMMAGSFGLLFNLYRLQVVISPSLEEKARQQQMIYMRPFIPRRPIVDRNGNVLAVDRRVYTLYVHPKLFKLSKANIATQLAPILDKSSTDLETLFNKRNTGIQVSGSLTEDTANKVTQLSLDGIELIPKYSRLYPQQELAADVVGYVNVDHQGQAGIEYSQEKLLEREIRTLRMSRAGNGTLMPDHIPEGFIHSDDLRLKLTLDSRLQRAARSALKQKIKEFNAKRGTVIVMDALDGSLLVLVSEPTYNPNHYSTSDISLFKNWALADLYEPGSTFKPLNVAIALESGVVRPDSLFNDTGSIQIGRWPIANYDKKAHGMINPAQILRHSSNVGMVRMMQQMKPEVYYGWLERLGLGQKLETDLPFETAGQLKNQRNFTSSPIEPATTAFGQGFSLTPLQLAQLHATLANGGKLVMPYMVQGLFDSQGQLYWQPRLSAPRPIFSPETSQNVLEMMETVVSQGTGKTAQISGYRVAGKTGTAQKASPTGGYFTNAKITSFVGILGVDSPRYVVMAVVDEPKGNAFGSTVAAPIVKSVMEALIAIEQIPPSQPTVATE